MFAHGALHRNPTEKGENFMTNFDFLQKDSQFKAFSDACIEAENSISASPALCALGVRKSAELAVKWLYSIDPSLQMPYKDNFSALVFNPTFTDSVDEDILNRLRFIIKLGNFAAHTSKQVTYKEAVLSLSNLFDFIMFINYCYGSEFVERTFDESLLAANKNQSVSPDELEKLQEELDARSKDREKMAEEMKRLRAEMAAMRQENQQKRAFTPDHRSEAETRNSIIDINIKSMGWTFGKDCVEELPVIGMPNDSGTGKVDYVLYGDDGKPLAVVEAKKTTADPKIGQHQAFLYANCLEKMTGQRPLIFYTNGYTTWFWDDMNYPERKAYSVFSKQDLQRIIDRRTLAKEFHQLNINPAITDRDYQKIAIQRVCEEYTKKRRKALLVMATGTGKTRTAVSLVDVLASHRWITNILFLADRKELVKQAKQAFTRHMPNLSTCNLLERGEDKPTDRAIFSTYPTIMNAINEEKTEDGQLLFTPGHFDLIIVDEAHRSIFKKYRAIFDYFDALLIGLTATPKSDVGHNTYEFFDLEDNMPTYAYEYNEALHEHHLVDYHCIEKLFQIPTHGLHYEDLTPEQKQAYEDAFEEDDEIPDFISGSAIDKQFFNIDTTRRILTELMEKGLKVEGGDKLGKTIIFARRHKHAQFIKEQFDILYPQYAGQFAAVIDNKEKYHENLLTAFKDKNKYPQIAISVDMLDTGIDVPEILNLVFYKQVFSKSKFWQMFGRGTRLCEDLFGPGEDKTQFYIFDYLGNFAFFEQNPKGKDAEDSGSLAEKAFSLKVHIIRELQDMKYQTDELIPFRRMLVQDISSSIAALNTEQFQVRQQLEFVEKYADPGAFQYLDIVEADAIISRLARLVPALNDDEAARRLDILMYRMILAKAEDDKGTYISVSRKVQRIAAILEQKGTIPEVRKAKEMLAQIKTEAYWETASLTDIDKIREELRGLMHFLKKEIKHKVINITDAVLFEREGERFASENDLEDYYARASRYVTENEDKPVLSKLRNNIPLTKEDWDELENIFWHDIGTADEYKKAMPADIPLGKFVRSLTGLSEEAANAAFSEFLDEGMFTEAQIYFVKCIKEWIIENGTLEKQELANDDFAPGINFAEAFDDNIIALQRIMTVIEGINANALQMAA